MNAPQQQQQQQVYCGFVGSYRYSRAVTIRDGRRSLIGTCTFEVGYCVRYFWYLDKLQLQLLHNWLSVCSSCTGQLGRSRVDSVEVGKKRDERYKRRVISANQSYQLKL